MIFPPSWLLHPTVNGAGQAVALARLDSVTEKRRGVGFTIGFGNVCGGWPSAATEKFAPRKTR
jgi:hypothetical protein